MRRPLPMFALLVLLAAGAVTPADAATGSSPVVRLQAVELAAEDPMPGGTFVVLRNAGTKRIGLGCWHIRTRRADLVIRPPATLQPGGGLRLLFARGQVGNPDRIRLLSPAGRIVDSTPLLNDTAGDDRLFGRTTAGWVLARAALPAHVSDGKLVPLERSDC